MAAMDDWNDIDPQDITDDDDDDSGNLSHSINFDNDIEAPRRRSLGPSKNVSPQFERLKAIEDRTKHNVIMQTSETNHVLARCHSQQQSALFTALPREIRDLIWQLATAPYEDVENSYPPNKYYYRPGHTAPLKTDYALLLTCRRAWLEAHAFPMLQAEQCYWYYRNAPDARGSDWMGALTAANRRNFGHLHVFAQMCNIENLRAENCLSARFPEWNVKLGDFQPRMLHVTIRHTDWWYWESEAPLRFRDSWFKALLDTQDLRSTHILKLELETLDYKVDQLMPIVERLKGLESQDLRTHVVDGITTPTKFAFHREEVQTWSGPSNIDGQIFGPYKGRDTLNYHVVTLTWRLQFPEHPHAHVPSLRQAARVGVHTDESCETYRESQGATTTRASSENLLHLRLYQEQLLLVRSRAGASTGSADPENEHASTTKRMWRAMAFQQCAANFNADAHESHRRARFEIQMSPIYQKQWRQEWQPEGSLLLLED